MYIPQVVSGELGSERLRESCGYCLNSSGCHDGDGKRVRAVLDV